MSVSSKRQAALEDLINRLSYIQIQKGYNTDAGLNIFLGEVPKFGPDDPTTALGIVIGDDSPEPSGQLTRTRVPFEVWAYVPVNTAQPLIAIEQIIADIKEAVEIESAPSQDRYLGKLCDSEAPATLPKGLERGVTRGLRREEGSDYVGAAVEYIATFEEGWGSQ